LRHRRFGGMVGQARRGPGSNTNRRDEEVEMIITLSAIATSVLMQPWALTPRCHAPEPSASQTCIECYQQACYEYVEDFYTCDTIGCREFAGIEYSERLEHCPCPHTARTIFSSLNNSQRFDVFTILGTWR
jgi:hypothetical protein